MYKTLNGNRNLDASLYTYIEEIVITKDDGTKYYFGGDLNAIEFSFVPFPKYSSDINTNEWRTLGSANSWMLKKIELCNGEVIVFDYEKSGIPIVMSDNHYGMSYIIEGRDYPVSYFDTKHNNYRDLNFNFIFIQPSYLRSIKSLLTNNEVFFKKAKTTELKYNINPTLFQYRVGDFYYYSDTSGEFSYDNIMAENYYMQLSEIQEKNRKILFEYSNSLQSRLKLLSISIWGNNNKKVNGYNFEYNDEVSLPLYNSKKTDKWGYYNNQSYANLDYETLNNHRIPNETYMQAEILKKIIYPTGGYSQFYYEAHHYSKVALQFPFSVQPKVGIAGGLRIKKIIDSDNDKTVSRQFEYIDSLGNSSGILSGNHVYYVFGKQHFKMNYGRWWGLVYAHIKEEYTGNYYIMQENCINRLSTANGNHVTYSRIVEKLSDGSKIIYKYSNHEDRMDELPEQTYDNINDKKLSDAFTSKELERGLLLETQYVDNKGVILKTEKNVYNSNPNRYNEYVRSVNQTRYLGGRVTRLNAYKIYTFCPYLESKIVTTNDVPGLSPVTITTHFEYNNHKLLSKTVSTNSQGGEEIQLIRYSCDISNGIYQSMQGCHMLNLPVEKVQLRNGYVIGAELTTYKKNTLNNDYVPDKMYKLRVNFPIPYSSFVPFNGLSMDNHYETPEIEYVQYDRNSNIIGAIQKDFYKATYCWSDDGLYPVATFENARNTYSVASQYQDVWATEYIKLKYSYLSDNVKNYEFYTSKSGTVEFHLSGALGYNWYITGNLDGKPVTLVQIRSSVNAGLPWTNYQTAYTYKATFTGIPAGYHIFRLQATDSYKGTTAGNYDGDLSYSYWRRESMDTEITGNDDAFYENFESYPSTAIPFGFYSDKSYMGPYTISLHYNLNKTYSIDYQVFRGGQWHYVKHTFRNGSYTINEGNAPIDDVRVYPDNAIPTSFNYIPFVGLRSKTDDKGVTESYEYDPIGRLVAVRDNEQNLVNQFGYHYYDETAEPGVGIPYSSVECRKTFTRNNCNISLGEVGKSVEYVVAANKFTSTISQEDANKKAFNDLMTNGQRYANEHAECGAYVIVSVYNPSGTTCVLNYDWGVQGSITTDRYEIPASTRLFDTGDIFRDFQPTVVYVPRRNYRQTYIFVQGDPSNRLNFSMQSSAYGNAYYDIYSYPGHEDVYVLDGYFFDY